MLKMIVPLALAATLIGAASIAQVSAAVPARVAAYADSAIQWGYGYDSLLRDLAIWRKHPNVRIDSIGASSQGRAIWMVTITDGLDSLGPVDDPSARKHRVIIHARTHPAEVQVEYIANEAIKQLLDTGFAAERLRSEFIFNIIPMYNPDGVELGHSRLNAHLVDLEGDWNKQVLEPEVVALKRTFETFQAGPIPVDVALNLHSDTVNCTRFFFFHAALATSGFYADLEKNFIGGVQSHFPGGIRDWSYLNGWSDGFLSQYPESFWWTTQREKVMALTYEDSNCPNAGGFDSTGRALVLGARDYVAGRMQAALRKGPPTVSRVLLSPEGVRIYGGPPGSYWQVDDLLGRRLAGGSFGAQGILIAWRELRAAPTRILSVMRPFQTTERVRLPLNR